MSSVERIRVVTASPRANRGEIVDRRPCPGCGATVEQIYRPGRARVYCSQACRQRTYRWRRANGIRLCVERNGPAENGSTWGRRHALRDARDPSATLGDHRHRVLTVCGTFARPARYDRVTHREFLPDHPWSCDACLALIGVGVVTGHAPRHIPAVAAHLPSDPVPGFGPAARIQLGRKPL